MRKLRERYQKEKGKMYERKGNVTNLMRSDLSLSHRDFPKIFCFINFSSSSNFLAAAINEIALYCLKSQLSELYHIIVATSHILSLKFNIKFAVVCGCTGIRRTMFNFRHRIFFFFYSVCLKKMFYSP